MIFNLITQYVLRHLTTIYIDSKEEKLIQKVLFYQKPKEQKTTTSELFALKNFYLLQIVFY